MLHSHPQNVLLALAAASAFGLVLSVWLFGILLWRHRSAKQSGLLTQRLKLTQLNQGGETGRVLRLWHEGQEATTIVPWQIHRNRLKTYFEKWLLDAGWDTPLPTALLGLGTLLLLVAGVAYLLTSALIITLAAVMATLIICWLYLSHRIARRSAIFERQLIDALDLATRSQRVGHPLVGSFQLISEEIPHPVGELFGQICQQQALGIPLDQALRAAADSSTSEDMKLFATSVVIQVRSGGNLADMMQRLADVIRERIRLARRIKVLTSQTQFSKRVLLALPFLIFLLMTMTNPTYMRPLYTTDTGRVLAGVASLGLVLGWLSMNWLSKLNP